MCDTTKLGLRQGNSVTYIKDNLNCVKKAANFGDVSLYGSYGSERVIGVTVQSLLEIKDIDERSDELKEVFRSNST